MDGDESVVPPHCRSMAPSRCWKFGRSRAASTRFACSYRTLAFPIVGDRKYGSRGRFRRESPCIRGGWSWSIR